MQHAASDSFVAELEILFIFAKFCSMEKVTHKTSAVSTKV